MKTAHIRKAANLPGMQNWLLYSHVSFLSRAAAKETDRICAEFGIFAENRYLAECIWKILSGITWNQYLK